MADIRFNVALGRFAHYASLPGTNDALIAVLLESSGLESDAILIDKTSLADLLAGTTNEQTTIGRKTLANVTVTVDNVNDWLDIDADDIALVAPTGNAVGAVVICYDPDTTASADANIIPLTKHDWAFVPTGTDKTIELPAGGFLREG